MKCRSGTRISRPQLVLKSTDLRAIKSISARLRDELQLREIRENLERLLQAPATAGLRLVGDGGSVPVFPSGGRRRMSGALDAIG